MAHPSLRGGWNLLSFALVFITVIFHTRLSQVQGRSESVFSICLSLRMCVCVCVCVFSAHQGWHCPYWGLDLCHSLPSVCSRFYFLITSLVFITHVLCLRDFLGKNTGAGCHLLLQGFPHQGLNTSLLHRRQILYQLSCQGSPIMSATLKTHTLGHHGMTKVLRASGATRITYCSAWFIFWSFKICISS